MPRLLLALVVQILAASTALAVNWDTVSLSFVTETSGDNVVKNILTTRSYLNLVAARDNAPAKDFFVGYNETSGEISVVHTADGEVRYFIVYGLGSSTAASDATGLNGSAASSASMSTLSISCSATLYDLFAKKSDGTFKTLRRTLIARGSSDQHLTVTGTARIGGKRYHY